MPRRRPSRVPKILGQASGPPKTPAPAELRALLEELATMHDAGTLTQQAFMDAYRRGRVAVEGLDDDERLAHLEPLWAFGALVGCLRE